MDLSKLFGGKSWYKSITAWGVILWAMAAPGIETACDPNIALLSVSTCNMLSAILAKVGAALTVIGIRRASTAPNTE
jgi:hypothetical protein